MRREWCCGMFGKRVGETKAEEEARIMAKKIKHEGYTKVELLFHNAWAPLVFKARFPLAIVALIWLVICSIFAAQLQPAREAPDLLGPTDPTRKYEELRKKFGDQGNCDYCSAFFRSYSDFPRPSEDTIRRCAETAVEGQQMFSYLDECGVCNGNNACVDCRGSSGGNHVIDECGICKSQTDPTLSQCADCRPGRHANCTLCGIPNVYGATCTKICDSTTCFHGTCDVVTGECHCHRDYAFGFWDSAPAANVSCNVCATGFSGVLCTVECEMESTCACNNDRCVNCPAGWFGRTCSVRNASECDPERGILSTDNNRHCVCQTGWEDQRGCHNEAVCNYHGRRYNATQVPPAFANQCICRGQWRGPFCSYCACYNGGTCDTNGVCQCPDGWDGPDCRVCPQTCQERGHCATPWSVTMYGVRTCRALHCTDAELTSSNPVSPACIICQRNDLGNCTGYTGNATACEEAASCEWDAFSSTCVSVFGSMPPSQNNTHCRCRGHWLDGGCTVCDTGGIVGVSCNINGVLVGCDGQPAHNGRFKVVDNCGNCGGDSRCVGCDGIQNSIKVLDSCGICGGANECVAAGGVRPTAEIIYTIGMSSSTGVDIEDTTLQTNLSAWCRSMLDRNRGLVKAQSQCVWLDYVTQTTLLTNSSQTNAQRFFVWATQNGRLGEVGFSSTDATSASLRVKWMAFPMRAQFMEEFAPLEEMDRRAAPFDTALEQLKEIVPDAIFVSDALVNRATQRSAKNGVIFMLCVGGLVFAAVTLAATCSPTLCILACCALVSNVVTVLAVFQFAGWSIGPFEQVGLSLLLGTTAEQLVHLLEGYMDHLHAAQSHMFARENTQLQSLRGMYQRAGSGLVLAGVTVILCATPLYATKLAIFPAMATLVIVIVAAQLVTSLVFFGAFLSIAGPTESFRNFRTMSVFAMIGLILFLLIFLPLYFTGKLSLD